MILKNNRNIISNSSFILIKKVLLEKLLKDIRKNTMKLKKINNQNLIFQLKFPI